MIWKRIEVVITSCTRNAVVRKGSWVRIPPLPPKTIPRKSRVYAGFLMPFCGALISHCGLKWCPELLKTYKKQREAIKRYCGYSSISLLFFLVFLFGLHHFLKRNFAGVGLYGRFPKQIFFVPAARPHTAPLLLQGLSICQATYRYLLAYAPISRPRCKSRPLAGAYL